jgi:hypothetical protein
MNEFWTLVLCGGYILVSGICAVVLLSALTLAKRTDEQMEISHLARFGPPSEEYNEGMPIEGPTFQERYEP